MHLLHCVPVSALPISIDLATLDLSGGAAGELSEPLEQAREFVEAAFGQRVREHGVRTTSFPRRPC